MLSLAVARAVRLAKAGSQEAASRLKGLKRLKRGRARKREEGNKERVGKGKGQDWGKMAKLNVLLEAGND